jgi:hypothetical protein
MAVGRPRRTKPYIPCPTPPLRTSRGNGPRPHPCGRALTSKSGRQLAPPGPPRATLPLRLRGDAAQSLGPHSDQRPSPGDHGPHGARHLASRSGRRCAHHAVDASSAAATSPMCPGASRLSGHFRPHGDPLLQGRPESEKRTRLSDYDAPWMRPPDRPGPPSRHRKRRGSRPGRYQEVPRRDQCSGSPMAQRWTRHDRPPHDTRPTGCVGPIPSLFSPFQGDADRPAAGVVPNPTGRIPGSRQTWVDLRIQPQRPRAARVRAHWSERGAITRATGGRHGVVHADRADRGTGATEKDRGHQHLPGQAPLSNGGGIGVGHRVHHDDPNDIPRSESLRWQPPERSAPGQTVVAAHRRGGPMNGTVGPEPPQR